MLKLNSWCAHGFLGDTVLHAALSRLLQQWPKPCEDCGVDNTRQVVIDVGAHTGADIPLWLGAFGRTKGCNCTALIVYEPNPGMHPHVAQAIRGARDHVIMRPVAVADRAGQTTLVVPMGKVPKYMKKAKGKPSKKDQEGMINHNERAMIELDRKSYLRQSYSRTMKVVHVTVTTLSEDIPRQAHGQSFTIPLLKVDAEGYDYAVLRGAQQLLPKVKGILFECSTSTKLEDTVRWLADVGFLTFQVGEPFFVRLHPPYWDATYADLRTWSNCVAFPSGSPVLAMLPVLC